MSKRERTECPVCYDDDHPYSTNWHCCSEGHSWCETCSSALRNAECPVCKVEIDVNPSKRSKNLLMKQLIGQETTVCEHCDQTMTKEAYADHDVAACAKTAYVERMVSKTLGNGDVHHFEGNKGKEKLVRVVHTNGFIRFFEDEKHVRFEFAASKSLHGTIQFFEDNKHVRTEYAKSHPKHGMIESIFEGDKWRIEFHAPHPHDGKVEFYMLEYDGLVRTEYHAPHPQDGKIEFYELGGESDEHVRTEYNAPHPHAGLIEFYEDGKHVRNQFAAGTTKHGVVEFFESGKHVRTEYNRAYHGRIDFYEDGKLKRREYHAPNPAAGSIIFYEDNKGVCEAFNAPHSMHGVIQFYFYNYDYERDCHIGKHVRTEYAVSDPRHGLIEFFEDGKHVRSE
jgi:preprotein translocase subunit Sec61beta